VEKVVKEIKLTMGKVALVDDEDFEKLSAYNWYAQKGRNTWYAQRKPYDPDHGHPMILMHRVIMGNPAKGVLVDHIDRNGLNNVKSNLRLCSNQENQMNKIGKVNSTSQYKGVSWASGKKKWRACIRLPTGGNKHIGYYTSELAAAIAYNKVAEKLHDKFAHLNKIEGVEVNG
jgi:hypothetical protein